MIRDRNLAALIPKLSEEERDWAVDLLSNRILSEHPHLIVNYMFRSALELYTLASDIDYIDTNYRWLISLKTLKIKLKNYIEVNQDGKAKISPKELVKAYAEAKR